MEDDFKIVWETRPNRYFIKVPMVDITKDNILIYNGINEVTITNLSSIETGVRYNL